MTGINRDDDFLYGAEEIALFVFGRRADRRKVMHLITLDGFPHTKVCGRVCSWKSRLHAWIEKRRPRSTPTAEHSIQTGGP